MVEIRWYVQINSNFNLFMLLRIYFSVCECSFFYLFRKINTLTHTLRLTYIFFEVLTCVKMPWIEYGKMVLKVFKLEFVLWPEISIRFGPKMVGDNLVFGLLLPEYTKQFNIHQKNFKYQPISEKSDEKFG